MRPPTTTAANAHRAKNDQDRALADYDKAIELDPKFALAYSNRGLVHTAKGDNAAAIGDYRKLLDLPALTATDRQRQEIARERIARLTQTQAPPTPAPATGGGMRRVALVIGNSDYASAGLLGNPKNDAKAMAAAFRRLGFSDVAEGYDLSREAMGRMLKQFGDRTEGADWAVVFFAGHGIELNGATYLIPIDAELKRDTPRVRRGDIADPDPGQGRRRQQARPGHHRRLPQQSLRRPHGARRGTTRSIGRGLPPVEPEGNVLVAYAAKHGTTADDGGGDHSPFTEALLANIEEPGLEINFLFRKVRDQVRERTAAARSRSFTARSAASRCSSRPSTRLVPADPD